MSKAFTKEDVDPPERSGRVRSPSGLPPGALNYMTASGARRLQKDLAALESKGEAHAADRRARMKEILQSATVVELDPESLESVMFGAQVTVRDGDGQQEIFRIVGVDELEFWPEAVSWISPNGKALLAAEMGGRLQLENGRGVKVVEIRSPG